MIEKALINIGDLVEDSKFIRNAAIPVLKIDTTAKYFNKKIDLTLQESRHNGLNCVNLVKDYLSKYNNILRPIVLVLKQMLFMTQ